MKSARRIAVYRILSAVCAAVLLVSLLSVDALASGGDGLTVETLTFRDVLANYAADKASFGENASETDGAGVTNAAKYLAELFTFTVGLNYTGEGLNCNFFGKDISAQMGSEPYTDANRLASYDVEILPCRSYATPLPQGQTTTISVYLAGYTNAAASGGVETVLHYVWQEQGVWYAVKDDNPYYRVRFNGKSAHALAADGLSMALAHAENGTGSIGAWENLSAAPDGNGVVTLPGGTLLAGQGGANLLGVTDNFSALAGGSLSHDLLAVSDFLRGDTTYQTGPLVYRRDCYEAGTSHRVADGEALREGVTYEFRVQYAEALSVAAGMRGEDVSLVVRSEQTNEEFPVSDFVWLGSSEHLTGDEYNPYTVTFRYTPSCEGVTVCSFVPVNLTGESSALAAAPFHACTETAETAASEPEVPAAVLETAAASDEIAALPTPEAPAVVQTASGAATPMPLRTAESGAPATRALLAQTLWNLFDRPAAGEDVFFSDLPSDADAAQAIRWAAQSGLIVGYGDGTFRPDEPVTREQTAVILCRYAALRGADTSAAGDLAGWSDGDAVSPWAEQAVVWAVQTGTLSANTDGTLAAHETATCGALSEMLMNLQMKL